MPPPLDANLLEFQTPCKKSNISPSQPEAGSAEIGESLTRDEEVPLNMEILSPQPLTTVVVVPAGNILISVSSSVSRSGGPSSSGVMRSFVPQLHASSPVPRPPPMQIPYLPNLPGLFYYGRGPFARVDFTQTTNFDNDSFVALQLGDEFGSVASGLSKIFVPL